MINATQKVFILIVNWNGKKDTLECLRSINKLVVRNIVIQVILIDNGSTDGSAEAIVSEFPHAHLISTGNNLGFTGGNNLGIEYALARGADYIWLLNNDTIVESRTLHSLLSAIQITSADIAGPKIYFYPGREFHHQRYKKHERGKVIWYAGGLIDWKNVYAYHRCVDEVDVGQCNTTTETSFVTGCSMLVKSSVFKEVGLLDKRYYLYLEDVDFCIRAARKNKKLIYVGSSIMWHKNAMATDRPGNDLHQYYFTRNQLLLGFRFAPLRSKIALIRQAFRFALRGPDVKKRAVFDAILLKFGEGISWNR